MEEENRIYTIHKSNSLIRASLVGLNLQQLKFLNAIYYLTQKNKKKVQQNDLTISVKYSKLIDLMGYSNSKTHPLSKIISEAKIVLVEPIFLNNYISKKGKVKKWKKITLIEHIEVNKGYRNTLDIKISKSFLKLIKQKIYWTKINLTSTNQNLTSFFQQRLYEYLKSYNNLDSRKLSLYLDDYKKIFEGKEIYFSNAKLKIDRSIEHINKTTDLDIKVNFFKNKNLIVFTFNNITDIEATKAIKKKKEETYMEEIIESVWRRLP